MSHSDRHGRSLSLDDRVRILKMPDGMSDGLPEEEKPFVESCEGAVGLVDELLDDGYTMVELYDTEARMSHAFYIPATDLEKQD